MWKEFKEFALKGSVLDMAVGVVIGGAFGQIVTSLVNDIIMPLVGQLTGGTNFNEMKIVLNAETGNAITYGNFIQTTLNFFIIAFFIFLVVRFINRLRKPVETAPKGPSTEELLIEIRDELRKE